ncbi:MAG: alpha-L-fucosidase [Aggregatilineales bacterium]
MTFPKSSVSLFEPTWQSLAKFSIPTWYQDAKFGIFIHWGVYSVPAYDNEWYPRNMYLPGSRAFQHHQKVWGHQSKFGYKDFIPMFKAEKFDPDQWAALFKQAGAKYIVPVAEHHDGFAMYDSSHSDWTAVKMGPKRDIIGDLAAAVRSKGLIFGLSNHRAEHWWFMNGGKTFDSDVQNAEYAGLYGPAAPGPREADKEAWNSIDWQPRPDAKFLENWLARNCELVDSYQPQLYYFDWWTEQIVFKPYLQRFASHYYNRGLEWSKGVAINCKNGAFPEGTVVFDVERGQLKDIRPVFWQTDTAVAKNSWGYTEEQDYKSADSIIHDLIDIVSKNGTLLLNIGPRPDGTIPEAEEAILNQIGRWLSVNGEAVYATRPWKIYGEGPTEVIAGPFQDTKRAAFTARDVRFTTKGDVLYAVILGVPENGEALIQSLGSSADLYPTAIKHIHLLGTEAPVQWSREVSGLRVKIPLEKETAPALVLKIE